MPSNRTTVQKTKNGQYIVTIPKAMAEARYEGGEEVVWTPTSATALRMDAAEGGDDDE